MGGLGALEPGSPGAATLGLGNRRPRISRASNLGDLESVGALELLDLELIEGTSRLTDLETGGPGRPIWATRGGPSKPTVQDLEAAGARNPAARGSRIRGRRIWETRTEEGGLALDAGGFRIETAGPLVICRLCAGARAVQGP